MEMCDKTELGVRFKSWQRDKNAMKQNKEFPA